MRKTLAADIIATGAATKVDSIPGPKTYGANGATSASTGAATILIEGSFDGATWSTIATLSLTLGTTATATHANSPDAFPMVRANITAITGTGAKVQVQMAGDAALR